MLALATCVVLVCTLGITQGQLDPNAVEGRSVIVHLFEWKFDDIADECERFLGPKGYAGIQLSPVSENLIVEGRPWWERYQPVSYKVITRSGDEASFASMARRCNDVGVRVYVDVILNHMTGRWDNAVGTGGSQPDTLNKVYPDVPYGPQDFNDFGCVVDNYNDANIVRNCELDSLHDLNQGLASVRQPIIAFLNKLIDSGVAGFRVDAAKYMWPGDLKTIFDQVKDLNVDFGFASGSRPFIYSQIPDLVEDAVKPSEYFYLGKVTEFKYGNYLATAFNGNNPLKWLVGFGEQWNMLPSEYALVFIDNHDNQRGHNRADEVLTYKVPRLYKMATAFMLAWPYGLTRLMSSFEFEDSEQGPPSDSEGNIVSPTINPDDSCGSGWVCEHRWRQIYNMVAFRNVVNGAEVLNWWDNGNYQIAFSRGNSGFIVINDEVGMDLKQTLQTNLAAGTYCDVISGSMADGSCTGKSVVVNDDGTAYLEILDSDYDGVIAIHINAKLN